MVEQPERREFFDIGEERPPNPEGEHYFRLIFENHLSRWGYGEVNPVRHKVSAPSIMTQEIKSEAFSLGASLVGITTTTQDHVYQGSEVPEKYLISLAMEMDHDPIATAPSAESGAEAARIYYELGEVPLRLKTNASNFSKPAAAL